MPLRVMVMDLRHKTNDESSHHLPFDVSLSVSLAFHLQSWMHTMLCCVLMGMEMPVEWWGRVEWLAICEVKQTMK